MDDQNEELVEPNHRLMAEHWEREYRSAEEQILNVRAALTLSGQPDQYKQAWIQAKAALGDVDV